MTRAEGGWGRGRRRKTRAAAAAEHLIPPPLPRGEVAAESSALQEPHGRRNGLAVLLLLLLLLALLEEGEGSHTPEQRRHPRGEGRRRLLLAGSAGPRQGVEQPLVADVADVAVVAGPKVHAGLRMGGPEAAVAAGPKAQRGQCPLVAAVAAKELEQAVAAVAREWKPVAVAAAVARALSQSEACLPLLPRAVGEMTL